MYKTSEKSFSYDFCTFFYPFLYLSFFCARLENLFEDRESKLDSRMWNNFDLNFWSDDPKNRVQKLVLPLISPLPIEPIASETENWTKLPWKPGCKNRHQGTNLNDGQKSIKIVF